VPQDNSVAANIVDLHQRRIDFGEVQWRDGRITRIERLGPERAGQSYLLPGFVDAHVHIESSMLTPAEFGRIACRHGTVATVSDPHEIANVLGLEGVRFMADNADRSPFRIFWGAPSCVPATGFETSGATLGSADLEQLFTSGKVNHLAEVMDFPGVLSGNPEIAAKLAVAARHGAPVDGHAPGLKGEEVRGYAAAGISTDHECSTVEEAESKLAAGMSILIREGSAARDFDALHPLIGRWPDRVMFCSDDKHPDDLLEGHINRLVARAVGLGHDLFSALGCACLNPVRHYRLPLGLLRTGDRMDAVEVDNLRDFGARRTWINGELVAECGASLLPVVAPRIVNRFNARAVTPQELTMGCAATSEGSIRVIRAFDGELLTQEVHRTPTLRNGCMVPDSSRDLLLLTVVNRYRPAQPAVAFIEGFGLKEGALASSVAHDSHNIVAVGTSAEAVCAAVNAVVSSRGGIAVASKGTVDLLPLPVAGLMSEKDGETVGRRYAVLHARALQLGTGLRAPFMTLSFMALLVIPELKLSDRGLFDGRSFRHTSVMI
jgi:adenine deaminase